uniref:Uncharacterized protein n=1 Tax=Vitis vinifera TaxID=29760 RepID=F6H161_VITVI
MRQWVKFYRIKSMGFKE